MCRWVYEKDIYPNTEETRNKKAKLLADLPRKARKNKREDEEDDTTETGKKKKTSEAGGRGDQRCDDGGKKNGGGKWMDAVAPEVKSDMSREEKKMQAEMMRFKKLEAQMKMRPADESDSGSCARGGDHLATCNRSAAPGRSTANTVSGSSSSGGGPAFRSLAQAISMRQSATASPSVSKSEWPSSVYRLRPGVNDTWNSYQVRACIAGVLC